jgi:RNA polymerase sigma-70 factor (ECF subfamily)
MGVHDFPSVLSAAQEGSEWAWSALYAAYAPRLRGYIRARGAADPDGVLGDVFVQLAKHLGSFRGEETAFQSWIFMVARHRVIDEHRRRSRRDEVPLDGHDRHTVPSAESAALDALGDDRVVELLAAVTPAQREVLALRIVGDLSLDETARVMGRRVGAIKQLQRRALLTLHQEIAKKAVTL